MIDKPYTIKYRSPYRGLIALLAIAIVGGGLWYWNMYWQNTQNKSLTALQKENAQLTDINQTLTTSNKALQSELDNSLQMQAIQNETTSRLQQDMQKLQDKVIELNKELLFYQNITQGNTSSELQIRELHLAANAENSRQFFYRVVLTQGKKVSKSITGDIQIQLAFKGNKPKPRILNNYSLKIKHVQVVEGVIELAGNEQPASIQVILKNGKKLLTKRNFDWEITSIPE